MTKKHFIALADSIIEYNKHSDCASQFYRPQLDALAAFCLRQNHNFNMNRWLGYIAGTNGSNGGKVKTATNPLLDY